MTTRWMNSPIGGLRLHSDGDVLTAINFDAEPLRSTTPEPILDETERQLREYFDGERQQFDLPLARRGTDFQRRVWDALIEIPFGTTTTYGRVAAGLGLVPGASRAVGLANGSNPIPVIVPCHRVIGASGTLTGYAGGVDKKQRLLDLEGAQSALF